MIYDKLRKLPKVVQDEIYETGNIRLLTDDDTISNEDLLIIWESLDIEYRDKYHKSKSNDIFLIIKEIEFQIGRYDIINICVEQLKFSWSDEVYEILLENGYKIDKSKEFHGQYEKIIRESSAIINKIKILQDKLPKQSENKIDTIDIMMSYSAITGISFDTNTISVTAYHAIEKQAFDKIKSLEKQIEKQKNNNKR